MKTQFRIARFVLLTCVAMSLSLFFARTSIAADEPERPTVTLPVRVHLMQSETNSEFNTSLEEKDIKRIFGKVNKVWSQAGVQFELESIETTKAAEVDSPDKYAIEFQRVRAAIPRDRLATAAINVCYIKKFTPNGLWYTGIVFVKDTAHLNSVEDGLDEPLPRVTSHELGHALGLEHRQDRINLMASGNNGFSLNDEEIKTARQRAVVLKAKLAAKAETKKDVLPESKSEVKADVKIETKTDTKADSKSDSKPEPPAK